MSRTSTGVIVGTTLILLLLLLFVTVCLKKGRGKGRRPAPPDEFEEREKRKREDFSKQGSDALRAGRYVDNGPELFGSAVAMLWDGFYGKLLARSAIILQPTGGGNRHLDPLRDELETNLKTQASEDKAHRIRKWVKDTRDKHLKDCPSEIAAVGLCQRLWSLDPPDMGEQLATNVDVFGYIQAAVGVTAVIDSWTVVLTYLEKGTKCVALPHLDEILTREAEEWEQEAHNHFDQTQHGKERKDKLPILYRGMIPAGELNSPAAWQEWALAYRGQKVVYSQIVSACQNKHNIDKYSLQCEDQEYYAVVQLHNVPNAKYSISSEYPLEGEVILPFGSVFTITGISWDGKYPQVLLNYIGEYQEHFVPEVTGIEPATQKGVNDNSAIDDHSDDEQPKTHYFYSSSSEEGTTTPTAPPTKRQPRPSINVNRKRGNSNAKPNELPSPATHDLDEVVLLVSD